jgi:hypothetical protein
MATIGAEPFDLDFDPATTALVIIDKPGKGSDCVASYFPEFKRVGLEMIKAQGAIFGWFSDSERAIAAMS